MERIWANFKGIIYIPITQEYLNFKQKDFVTGCLIEMPDHSNTWIWDSCCIGKTNRTYQRYRTFRLSKTMSWKWRINPDDKNMQACRDTVSAGRRTKERRAQPLEVPTSVAIQQTTDSRWGPNWHQSILSSHAGTFRELNSVLLCAFT